MIIGIIIGLVLGGVIGVFVMSCLFIAKKSDNNAEIDLLHQEIEGLRKMIDDYEEQKTQLHQLIEKLQEEYTKLWERKNEYKKMISKYNDKIRGLERNIGELEAKLMLKKEI